MRRRRYIGIAVLGGVGLILTLVAVSGPTIFSDGVQCSQVAVPPDEGPIMGGTATTITTAQLVVRFPVPTPDNQSANPSNLTQTWVNNQRYVALVYAGGKVTITMAPALYPSALREFTRFIAQNGSVAQIGRVRGQPALVITPHTDACASNPAWVELDRKGIDINIYSGSFGTDTLLSIAASLRERSP